MIVNMTAPLTLLVAIIPYKQVAFSPNISRADSVGRNGVL